MPRAGALPFALLVGLVACGGVTTASRVPDAGAPPTDAQDPVDASEPVDAFGETSDDASGGDSAPSCLPPPEAVQQIVDGVTEGGAGGYVFVRISDFLDYFRGIAYQVAFIDAARSVDCRYSIQSCSYDPTSPRRFPSDLHYSDALQRFVAPNGDPWVWVYFQGLDVWVAASARDSSETYDRIVAYLTCLAATDGG